MEPELTSQPHIDVSSLPDISKPEMDFSDTSFFQSQDNEPRQLPTPASIVKDLPGLCECVIKLENLNLAVKIGRPQYLRLEEAQSLQILRQIFPTHEVPVPEVFGWKSYRGFNFMYMSLAHGQTLREAWPSFTLADKEAVSSQLGRVVCALREINQEISDRWIGQSHFFQGYADAASTDYLPGSINRGPVTDRFFHDDYVEGPFYTIKAFNDWTLAAATRQRPGPEGVKLLPHRDLFPDKGNIYFTHGDLTLNNIIISGTPGSYKIESILDWEQAGWYLEYWEYCKMQYAVDYEHGWRTEGWAQKVMEPCEETWDAFADYSQWRCP
ncbi:hypothetical protein AK830_g3342 [Neonectria ditissima]|uniref:Aminoglycoside phosphotransferase domain-containing protein n=1 Tax=Neonectria ditissima TaxID=78410 RepID=A0A0P7BI93_9HYPO|nr:hypothetical protein AK830_g3342 [Neonectria ditissima]